MGVDITFFAEHRLPGGDWSIADELVANIHYLPDEPDFVDQPPFIPPVLDIPRCSALFAILANVNNQRTPVPFSTIAMPRGIPADASMITKAWFQAWGNDAFSASWLTLREIDSFDWNQVSQQYGNVDPSAAHLFSDNPMGFPIDGWPTGVPLSCSVLRTDSGNARWRETYAESAGFRWFREMLKPFESYEMLRFIFWFSF
jgi:hypothetical protein